MNSPSFAVDADKYNTLNRPNHSEKIFSSMEMIMTLVLEESEDISSELLLSLLNSVKCDNKVNFCLLKVTCLND